MVSSIQNDLTKKQAVRKKRELKMIENQVVVSLNALFLAPAALMAVAALGMMVKLLASLARH